MTNYVLSLLAFAGIYSIMALGLNVIWGLAGLMNLGLAGFYAVGAYASALSVLRLGWPIGVGMTVGTLVSAALGAAVAVLTARLRGDYLAIVTLAFAEIVQLVASNEIWLTHGTDGISGVPGPWRAALGPASFNAWYTALIWLAVIAVAALLARLSTAPFGRVLRGIREDETVVAVAGKRPLVFKVQAFTLSAAVLGLAGALYVHFNGYVAPDAFAPLLTLNIVLALTAGGTGTMRGAILGSVGVVALTEGTRFLGAVMPSLMPVQVASVRQAAIGAALILMLHWRPQGLVPERGRRYRQEP